MDEKMTTVAIIYAVLIFIVSVGLGCAISAYVIKQDMKNLKEDRFSERSRFK